MGNTQSDKQGGQGNEPRKEETRLDDLPASRYMQTSLVQDSVFSLYYNIQAILLSYKLKPFEIDSSFLKRKDNQELNESRDVEHHQVIDDGVMQVLPNEKHKKEIEMLIKDLSKSEKLIRKLEDDNTKAANKIKELDGSNGYLEKDLERKTLHIEELQKTNEKLICKIEKLTPPKIAGTVQLYHSHSGNTIKDIEEELKTMLNNHLKDVKFVKCNRITDIDQSQMLIVLSIIASRVGTDAANAIKDVPRPENTALLLFHIKEIHALTKQASTAVLTDRSFKDLGGIFDLAFVNGKGLYQCEMNENAMKSVCDFIKKGISGTGV
ncbi:structural maintenance of chromosomes protein 2-like isoform X2 [Ruditapes philippinarum]|uniref:structural maintenance of chromosomes protein 2-like isoform X2 n=1 Tax=Ruditapes philippinarum TaxID=129788 RepID=UPI00295B9B9A|nr:structural maintenance of chromosomes protein 2-like isoform X2 [Ruditapes philippinarum]